MGIQNVALINANDQVVNHVVVDTDDAETIAALHEQWGTVRYVVTAVEDVIIIDPSPVIWTTHTEADGFVPPISHEEPIAAEPTFVEITIGGRKYPSDSLLIKENASSRPAGWVLPAGDV